MSSSGHIFHNIGQMLDSSYQYMYTEFQQLSELRGMTPGRRYAVIVNHTLEPNLVHVNAF